MREIKFRIWDSSLNAFLESTYAGEEPWVDQHGAFGLTEYEFWTYQQFTGLTDSTGKEVWEGDIVCEKMTDDIAFEGGECNLGRIFFAAGSFMIDGDGPLYDHTHSLTPDKLEDYLVVGNVFENPDLLK